MILGLAGQKQSGKDTVAGYLIKEHGFERRAFADPLKRSVAALFNIPYHQIDQWKNDPTTIVGVYKVGPTEYHSEITFREMLQRYGTEAHRDVFDQDFWLNYTLPMDGYYAGKKIAITDCRFENEANRVRLVGGYVVNIERPDLPTPEAHASEAGLPAEMIDYTIMNDRSLQEFYDNIEVMLTTLGDSHFLDRPILR